APPAESAALSLPARDAPGKEGPSRPPPSPPTEPATPPLSTAQAIRPGRRSPRW
uniref:Uncharacterized protein n=1 Tax=Aegilops tauschii subsp. strangulata TaxID=200361 RepID=A0A453M9C9_AEGTS